MKKSFALFFLIFFLLSSVCAQTESKSASKKSAKIASSNSEISKSEISKSARTKSKNGSKEYYQHIEWESTGVVKQYELIIEKKGRTTKSSIKESEQQKKQEKYVHLKTFKTTENFYDISLPKGDYRYKVIFYNVLGQKAFETEYKNFSVKASMKDIQVVQNISDFFDASAKSTAGKDSASAKSDEKSSAKSANSDVSTKSNAKSDEKSNSDSSNFFSKLYENISGGYSFCGVLFDDFYKQYFETSVIPWEVYLQGNVLYDVKKLGKVENLGKFGLGVIFRESYLKNDDNGILVQANLFNFHINFVYTRPLHNFDWGTLFIESYTGFGFSFINDFYYQIADFTTSDKLNSILPTYDLGVKVGFGFYKHLFAEIGLEFTDAFAVKNADYSIGSLNTMIGIGGAF